jgi:rfaE bifunctional protein kinase chain/domain
MKTVVIGDAIVDLYVFGKINRMSPEDSNVPVVDTIGEEYRPGGCLNTASNLRSLFTGSEEVFTHSIMSVFTARLMHERGVKTCDPIFQDDTSPSTYELIKTRIINVEDRAQLLRVDNRMRFHNIDIEIYQSVFSSEIFNECDILVVSDYNKGLITRGFIEHINKFKGQVFVDTKQKDLLMWSGIKNCVIKINHREFDQSVNWWNVPQLIITRGSEGAELLNNGNVEERFPTELIENADVVGCGDAFLAGLVSSYAKSGDLYRAIKFANLVAGLNAKQQGTATVKI